MPTPDSIILEHSRNNRDGGNNQNDKLLSRGKAMSGAPIRRGVIQLPNPPIKVGITKKKIITKA